MENKNENMALSIFFLLSLVLHLGLLVLIQFEGIEALFAGSGNNYSQTKVQYYRLTGSGTPQNKGQVKTDQSQAEEKPKGNTEPKPEPAKKVEVVEPEKTPPKPTTTPTKTGDIVSIKTPETKSVTSDTPTKTPEPAKEKTPDVKVVTSDSSRLEVDFDADIKEATGQADKELGTTGSTSQSGSPDGTSDKEVPPKGEDYIINLGGSGGFTTKNIESLEYTGELEMIFEVDSDGNLTVVLVKGLGEERFNKELVNFAQRSWKGRFDQEARARFPNGYMVPIHVVFNKGTGTHKFGDVLPLE